MMVHNSDYFYGNKISDYGLENGYVDYATLAKAFDAVLNNDIMQKTCEIGYYWEQVSGMIDNSEEIEELHEQIDNIEFERNEMFERIDDIIASENDKEYIEIGAKIEELKTKIEELEEQIEELEEEQNEVDEIFQYFIVDDNGANILQECEEIVFYNEELDMYVWGVTHYGTSWNYVLTNIKLELE